MSLSFNPVIPKGSLVLITGVTGLIGSHIADQFLLNGYKVRGTTRDASKHSWITTLFSKRYGPEQFSLVAVPSLQAPGAFEAVIKGAAAVVHVATDTSLSPDPHAVIPNTVDMVVSALRSAAKEPSVKRFVLTSSSTAALLPKPDTPSKVTVDTWNEEVVKEAYRPPPYEPERAYPVYAAAKTLAEQAAWKFVREEKPGFELNTVLPNMNFGKSLDVVNQGHPSTAGWLATLYNGDIGFMGMLPAQYFVDVQDTARLHVAAAIHPDVVSERIFGFAEPVNGDQLLEILREMYPEKTFPENFQSSKDLSEIVPRTRAESLLKDMGQAGWTSLKDSVRWNTEDL